MESNEYISKDPTIEELDIMDILEDPIVEELKPGLSNEADCTTCKNQFDENIYICTNSKCPGSVLKSKYRCPFCGDKIEVRSNVIPYNEDDF